MSKPAYPQSLLITLLAVFTAALCAAGPLALPLGQGAPITLSVFVLVTAGYLLGPLWGLVPVAAYILLGAAGAPVFSGSAGGLAILFGPTGGYIFGWFLIVFLTGWFANRFHNPILQFAGVLAGELAFYLVGVAWYMAVAKALLVIAVLFGVLSFLLSNLIQGIAGFLAGFVLRRLLLVRTGKASKSILLVVSIITLTLLAGCTARVNEPNGGAEPGQIVVKYGYQPGHAQAVIAREKGFYAQELGDKVDIQLVKFQSGPPLITALTSNQLDMGQAGDQPAIQAKANNVDIKIIGKFLYSDKVNGLIVRKDSGITSIKDLKGKKVGVTVGSTGQQLLYIYLDSVGLKPSDIRQVNLQPGDIVSSITFRNIDAAVTWEPYITLTSTQGTTRLIADGTGYKKEIDVIIGRNEFLQQYPEIAEGILKAQAEAGKWITENPEEALELVAKDAGLDASILEPIFSKVTVDEVNLTDEDIASIGESIEFSVKYKLIPEAFKPQDFIDTRYLEQAGLRP